MQAVYASKVNEEADYVVEWKHNYRLRLPMQYCFIWTTLCIFLLEILPKTTKMYRRNISYWNQCLQKPRNLLCECCLSVRMWTTHGISHFCDHQRAYSSKWVCVLHSCTWHFQHIILSKNTILLHSFSDSISLQDLLRMKVLITLDITHITIRTLLYQQETPNFSLCSLLNSADFCSIFQDPILCIHWRIILVELEMFCLDWLNVIYNT